MNIGKISLGDLSPDLQKSLSSTVIDKTLVKVEPEPSIKILDKELGPSPLKSKSGLSGSVPLMDSGKMGSEIQKSAPRVMKSLDDKAPSLKKIPKAPVSKDQFSFKPDTLKSLTLPIPDDVVLKDTPESLLKGVDSGDFHNHYYEDDIDSILEAADSDPDFKKKLDYCLSCLQDNPVELKSFARELVQFGFGDVCGAILVPKGKEFVKNFADALFLNDGKPPTEKTAPSDVMTSLKATTKSAIQSPFMVISMMNEAQETGLLDLFSINIMKKESAYFEAALKHMLQKEGLLAGDPKDDYKDEFEFEMETINNNYQRAEKHLESHKDEYLALFQKKAVSEVTRVMQDQIKTALTGITDYDPRTTSDEARSSYNKFLETVKEACGESSIGDWLVGDTDTYVEVVTDPVKLKDFLSKLTISEDVALKTAFKLGLLGDKSVKSGVDVPVLEQQQSSKSLPEDSVIDEVGGFEFDGMILPELDLDSFPMEVDLEVEVDLSPVSDFFSQSTVTEKFSGRSFSLDVNDFTFSSSDTDTLGNPALTLLKYTMLDIAGDYLRGLDGSKLESFKTMLTTQSESEVVDFIASSLPGDGALNLKKSLALVMYEGLMEGMEDV